MKNTGREKMVDITEAHLRPLEDSMSEETKKMLKEYEKDE